MTQKMDGFHLDQEEAAAVAAGRGKKETQDSSWSHSHVQAQHRRSKSASDRDLDVSRGGVLHPAKKEQNELHASPLSTRAYRTRSPLHERSAYSNKNTSLNQRDSLEKDIELMQLRLQQEKSMRIMLERAMGRASSTLSPGHRHFAAQAAYNIGGHIISANAIEQSIFCFRTPRIGRWLETILSTALRKKSGEERQFISSKFGLPYSQPLACFALCTGAFSDPVLKVYTASNVKEELEVAKREFLQANVVVKKSNKVFLPRVIERFAKEATISSDDLLNWVIENVDKKLQNSIQKCMDGKSKKKSSQVIDWLPYSSRFRYIFSKDLTEKPWWV
ncbi:hypothetical protein REPUB_Repub07fG0218600 [Reevesia pubescens]